LFCRAGGGKPAPPDDFGLSLLVFAEAAEAPGFVDDEDAGAALLDPVEAPLAAPVPAFAAALVDDEGTDEVAGLLATAEGTGSSFNAVEEDDALFGSGLFEVADLSLAVGAFEIGAPLSVDVGEDGFPTSVAFKSRSGFGFFADEAVSPGLLPLDPELSLLSAMQPYP
jgi:hypothetical protein